MKLYYATGACSLSPHIVLSELGLPYELVRVELSTHLTADGRDYTAINPKGYVPAVELDDGQLLTEGPAIVQYLADQKPAAGLLPPAGTLERARVQEWLTFIGTELHRNFTPLFNPKASADWKAAATANIERRFGFVEKALAGRDYLTGGSFCVADAYLFTVVNWTKFVKIDLAPWPTLAAFHQRVMARAAVQKALREEGLI
ncbi:MAG: glutathione transferase GstA [Gammaproteobacteria bacterium]|nr:glutathione transferase GstA [Gammaproteobacteria bacterium]MBU1602729.1 glutathione transferase GstA [Gammaproteobacteria bacterium]MBU2433534.1 glutathione transferase GstA [Gammaproteobacteria bacterium]MBU2450536.1 glutathione transferase GstA [Gammaproteobacteria bacterium]